MLIDLRQNDQRSIIHIVEYISPVKYVLFCDNL